MAARRVDWSFGPGHGPVSGVINAAGSAMAATMVADLAHTPPIWGLVAGTAAAAASTVSALWHDSPGRAVAYRALCWMAAGSWSAWSMGVPESGPWSNSALASLAIGTFAAGVTGLGLSAAERREEAQRIKDAMDVAAFIQRNAEAAQAAASTEEDRIAIDWAARIQRLCRESMPGFTKDEHIIGVELWPGEPYPGFTIDGNCPAGGSSWKTLQAKEEEFASDARLPDGCSVKVEPGVDRGAFLMRVMVRNALTEEKLYPRKYPHESINDPRLIAYRDNGQPVKASFRQEVALIVGPTGTGKTVTMNDLIAEHVKCVDVILCAIDFNGGSIAIPWLMSWRADPESCPREPISLVADTPEKALDLTEGILDVIKDRKQSYAHLKVSANTTLLPISAELPQFTIFVDEVAEILGMEAQRDPIVRKVAENLLEIQRIGRDSGGRLVIASLGATNETLGSRTPKIHSKIKLAMGGTPSDEIAYLMDTYKMTPEDAKYPGTAHIKLAQGVPFIGKVPYLDPSQIAEIARATSDRRPAPDARALQILGDRWTKRWERSKELLALLDAGVEALRQGESVSAVVAAVAPERAEGGKERETVSGGERFSEKPIPLGDAMANLEAARQRMRDAEPVKVPDSEVPADLPELPEPADFSVVEGWLQPGAPATDDSGRRKPMPRIRMRQLVWDSGEHGIGPTAVHEKLKTDGYGTTYQTVNGWMKDDTKAGLLDQAGDRAPYTRGPKMTDPYAGQG